MMYDAEKADSFLTKWKVQLVEPILQLAKSRDDIDIDKLLNKFEDGGDRKCLNIFFYSTVGEKCNA